MDGSAALGITGLYHKDASSKTVWMAVMEEKNQMLLYSPTNLSSCKDLCR
ncbi:hypothetical protein GF406_12365 [candidate division KSB1 bacterium]|nr:hypothetical protein [candidate division KSB1 bacterium]